MAEGSSSGEGYVGRDLKPKKPSKTSRAGLITRLGAAALATIGIVKGVEEIQPVSTVTDAAAGAVSHAGEAIVNDVSEKLATGGEINGRYLTLREDGSFIVTDLPQVVKIKYEPNADLTTRLHNGENIVVQNNPRINSGDIMVSPNDITATYAVRIAGGSFGGPTSISRFQIEYEGKSHTVGEWFQPTDEQGNPVNLTGEPLKEGENPKYVAANFATVIKDQQPTDTVQSGQ